MVLQIIDHRLFFIPPEFRTQQFCGTLRTLKEIISKYDVAL
jgi:hypothetical protein